MLIIKSSISNEMLINERSHWPSRVFEIDTKSFPNYVCVVYGDPAFRSVTVKMTPDQFMILHPIKKN